MNEKQSLLDLFEKVKRAAEEARQDRQDILKNPKLSQQGKDEDVATARNLFHDAVQRYQEQMIAIVDGREDGYIAYQKKQSMDYMKSYDYQGALMANISLLKNGHMSKIDIMAMIELYKYNGMATNMIYETLSEMKSPQIKLLFDRITVNKQLNAFESIRNVIKSKVNVGLLDRPAVWFGLGYDALLNEVGDDLTLLKGDATLSNKANSDPALAIHQYEGNGKDIQHAYNRDKPAKGKKQGGLGWAEVHPGTRKPGL